MQSSEFHLKILILNNYDIPGKINNKKTGIYDHF